MKIKMKIKNRSHRYDINRRGPRQGHKHTKYKVSGKCLGIIIHVCNKQRV